MSFDSYRPRARILRLLLGMLVCAALSCNILGSNGDKGDESAQETDIALGIQKTLTYESETQATQTAEARPADPVVSQPTPDLGATQAAMITPPVGDEPLPTQPAGQPTIPAVAPEDPEFEKKMRSATVLLYEDIVNYPQHSRYVKNTLNAMDMPYDDVGSAKGEFKNKILGGSPSGLPWDLIIVASEARNGIQGEFFEHLNLALERGSAIIFEVWHLDQIYLGKAALFLDKCGAAVRNYAANDISDVKVYPVSGANHPILNSPNSNITLENPTPVWTYSDLGDLLSLTGGGSGQIIMATNPGDGTRNGVVTVCEGGKVILQTFNSHNFPENSMRLLWENYIYNALKASLQGSQ